MVINIRNICITIHVFSFKKKKSEFKKGDVVKCMFNDSGHLFWPQLQEPNLIIKKLRYNYCNKMYSISFDGINFFYTNDFCKVT